MFDDHEVDPAQALAVGRQVDIGDLGVADSEAEHHTWLTAGHPDGPELSVDERQTRSADAPGEGGHLCGASEVAERLVQLALSEPAGRVPTRAARTWSREPTLSGPTCESQAASDRS